MTAGAIRFKTAGVHLLFRAGGFVALGAFELGRFLFEIIFFVLVVVEANGIDLAEGKVLRKLRMIFGEAFDGAGVACITLGIFEGDERGSQAVVFRMANLAFGFTRIFAMRKDLVVFGVLKPFVGRISKAMALQALLGHFAGLEGGLDPAK